MKRIIAMLLVLFTITTFLTGCVYVDMWPSMGPRRGFGGGPSKEFGGGFGKGFGSGIKVPGFPF